MNSCNKPDAVPENPMWDTRFKSYAFADGLAEELCAIFRDAEGLLLQSRVVKNSRSTTAGIFTVNGVDYFVKRSNVNSFFERVKRIGRQPRSMRNLQVTNKLEQLGIAVPQIFMTLSTAPGLLPGASYLITECFPEPMTAANNLTALLESAGSERNLASKIAQMACKLHDNGVEHGDFKLNNILNICCPDGSFKLGLFDFDGSVLYAGSCPDNVRIKELARIASSYFMRCCDLELAAAGDFTRMIRLWAEVYAQCGAKDFSGNSKYLRRCRKFLPRKLRDQVDLYA